MVSICPKIWEMFFGKNSKISLGSVFLFYAWCWKVLWWSPKMQVTAKNMWTFRKGPNLPVACWPISRAWTLVLKLCSYWTIFRQHQRAQPKFPITFSICMLLRLPFVNWSSGLAHRSFHLSGTYYYFSITQVIAIHWLYSANSE